MGMGISDLVGVIQLPPGLYTIYCPPPAWGTVENTCWNGLRVKAGGWLVSVARQMPGSEYTIRAPVDCVVEKIHIKEGDKLHGGDKLVDIRIE
jgi:pyruvate carboxylase